MSPLLQVTGLQRIYGDKAAFWSSARPIRAVDEVSLAIRPGETLGLVGESGCGKSTTGRLIVGLDRATDGEILFDGEDVTRLDAAAWQVKRRDIQIIFQNPQSALDPRMTLRRQIREPLDLHAIGPREGRSDAVLELMRAVSLAPELADRYPHQISGGQAQRVVIARALALRPRLIVCDEPVSALDVSVQATVTDLLMALQQAHGIAYLFISHDLRVVKKLSHRTAVMYLGEIVEEGLSDDVYAEPLHPYTMALIAAVPNAMPSDAARPSRLTGDPPSPASPPSGCRFHTRCGFARPICRTDHPALRPVAGHHHARCHFAEDFRKTP
jgi:oligopeptide/dipeptide ABC transporter ATP-binding protein